MSWILQIVGVVLLSVLADIVLPNGQVNKFIKGIFAVLLIFVLLTPVKNIINNEYNSDVLFFGSELQSQTDEAFVDDIRQKREEQTELMLYNALVARGVKVIEVNIEVDTASSVVNSVEVILAEFFDYSTVKTIIGSYISIPDGNIYIYEQLS